MIDGLLSGLLGGLFGPALATWMSRFKYWLIFLMAMFATYVYIFATGVKSKGLKATIEIILIRGFDPVFIFVPMGIGVIAVIIAFVGSLSVPKEDYRNKSDDK